eukprot:4201603-Pyramimonas_sp.AAC.1
MLSPVGLLNESNSPVGGHLRQKGVLDHVLVCCRTFEVSDVPAAQFERAGLYGVSNGVYQGPQRPIPTRVRPCGVVPGGCA